MYKCRVDCKDNRFIGCLLLFVAVLTGRAYGETEHFVHLKSGSAVSSGTLGIRVCLKSSRWAACQLKRAVEVAVSLRAGMEMTSCSCI